MIAALAGCWLIGAFFLGLLAFEHPTKRADGGPAVEKVC